MSDAAKLTIYFGERARAGGGFLADALVAISARHRLATSLVLRGVEGYGVRHQLRTDRLLSLSEDLPMVAVAVDARARIEAALADVRALPRFDGLITLERAQLLTAGASATPSGHGKLTVYLGRRERVASRAAHVAVVDLLHRRGIAGATVLLGVDGTRHGERRRARLVARNAEVPLMVIAVGDPDRIAGVVDEVMASVAQPLVTLERVRIGGLPEAEAGGAWQKVMVYSSDRERHRALLAELQRAGAPGATTLRGIWGYRGDRAPHGDRLLQLRRDVPLVTTLLDRPAAMARWFTVVERVMGDAALVTCETVPVIDAAPAPSPGGPPPPTRRWSARRMRRDA
jgi:PII-like signaling protein